LFYTASRATTEVFKLPRIQKCFDAVWNGHC